MSDNDWSAIIRRALVKSNFQSDEIINAHWTERTFYLSNDETSRKIKQIQLTTWSETELPDDIQFYQFLRHVKEEQTILENSAGDENPVVVHCSDGSLRTGLYICADQLLLQVPTPKPTLAYVYQHVTNGYSLSTT